MGILFPLSVPAAVESASRRKIKHRGFVCTEESGELSNFQGIANFIWSVADDVLRGPFKRGKYADVILPFTVLRRLDCALVPTKDKVLDRHEQLKKAGFKNPEGQLRRAAGYSFYNISPFDFHKLLDDPKNIGPNLRAYINAFSDNMREVLEKFKLRATIDTLEEKGILFLLIKKFCEVDLHPDRVDNHAMGTVFEDLIRRFNEQSNENPGEHFTPREVIRLMVKLLLNGDADILRRESVVRTIYDPACGSGGMLSIAREHILRDINPHADIWLFGQEVQDETFAVCKSDMYIKGDDRDADNIKPDSSLSRDGHPNATFDYMICNPPYGQSWKNDEDAIRAEEARGYAGRFGAGSPSIDDGQMLFLQHMLSKMKPVEEGGSRIAIVHNASPLFSGEVTMGSMCRNENAIRRWILENDYLEAIVSLPTQLFYNTGITTYIWLLTNRKSERRKGKVLLVNGGAARKDNSDKTEVFARKMRRSLGDKRNELADEHIVELARLAESIADGPYTKVFDVADFAYRRIQVERPLRLNFQVSSDRLARLREQTAFKNLAASKKKGVAGEEDVRRGTEEQEAILAVLEQIDSESVWKNRDEFGAALDEAFTVAGSKLRASIKKVVLAALSERDQTADACLDDNGDSEPDPELRDYENVPFKESINDYFEREVKPFVSDAWVNENVRDEKDGRIGKLGYEIGFTRYFYEYESPRPLSAIDRDLKELEGEIQRMLEEVTE